MLCAWCVKENRLTCQINHLLPEDSPCKESEWPGPLCTKRKEVKAYVGPCPTCHEERDFDLPCPYCGEVE
jgi:hypothetical protein